MVTKYSVGDTVLLKGKIKSISVDSNGISYSVELPNKSQPVKYEENDIYDVVIEDKDGKQ